MIVRGKIGGKFCFSWKHLPMRFFTGLQHFFIASGLTTMHLRGLIACMAKLAMILYSYECEHMPMRVYTECQFDGYSDSGSN